MSGSMRLCPWPSQRRSVCCLASCRELRHALQPATPLDPALLLARRRPPRCPPRAASPPGARGGGAADRHAELAAGLKDSLGASLMLHGAPFRVTHEDGRAQRMESSTFMLKKWLFTGACGCACVGRWVGGWVGGWGWGGGGGGSAEPIQVLLAVQSLPHAACSAVSPACRILPRTLTHSCSCRACRRLLVPPSCSIV